MVAPRAGSAAKRGPVSQRCSVATEVAVQAVGDVVHGISSTQRCPSRQAPIRIRVHVACTVEPMLSLAHGNLNHPGCSQAGSRAAMCCPSDPRVGEHGRTLLARGIMMRAVNHSSPAGDHRRAAGRAWAAAPRRRPPATRTRSPTSRRPTIRWSRPTGSFYAINNGLDTVILRPAAKAYRFVVPAAGAHRRSTTCWPISARRSSSATTCWRASRAGPAIPRCAS